MMMTKAQQIELELEKLRLLGIKGGPGSGNFGHAGRPGEVGGSAAGGGKQFTTAEECKQWARQAGYGSWSGKMEEDDDGADAYAAFMDYCGGDYGRINGTLRYAKGNQEIIDKIGHDIYGTQNQIADMDKWLDKAPRTQEDITVYRGMPPGVIDGEVYKDHGFVSTTMTWEWAANFEETLGGRNDLVIARIRLPKGSKGAYMGWNSPNWEENEFLLPRGSSFRVIRRTENVTWQAGSGNNWTGTVVDMEAIETP